MKTLTVAYITGRDEPHLEWFFDSLVLNGYRGNVIVVDRLAPQRNFRYDKWPDLSIQHVLPKPTVWQGKHRLTKADWWSAANSRNTAICLCKTDWVACLDDRSLLEPHWLDCVQQAMRHGYAVCGTYEKVSYALVQEGRLVSYKEPKTEVGVPTGKDGRTGSNKGAVPCAGEWFFGCNYAAPLEWLLEINGVDETCDGLGFEDVFVGMMLKNAGYPVFYDQRMKLWEDRTPGQCGPVMLKRDKGVSPRDKSHELLYMLKDLKRALHLGTEWDLRQVRKDVLAGKPWPVPTGPKADWYDGQALEEMIPG